MVKIDSNDLKDIAENHNILIADTDKDRKVFSKTLLTIYTPVTSGLLFLSTTLRFHSDSEKVFYLIVTLTSVSIVISALLERFGYYLISKQMTEKYLSHVRKTGKHLTGILGGQKWQSKLVEAQIYIMMGFLLINVLAVFIFVFINVNR